MLVTCVAIYLVISIVNFGKLVVEGRSEFTLGEFALYGLLWPLGLAAWVEGLIRRDR